MFSVDFGRFVWVPWVSVAFSFGCGNDLHHPPVLDYRGRAVDARAPTRIEDAGAPREDAGAPSDAGSDAGTDGGTGVVPTGPSPVYFFGYDKTQNDCAIVFDLAKPDVRYKMNLPGGVDVFVAHPLGGVVFDSLQQGTGWTQKLPTDCTTPSVDFTCEPTSAAIQVDRTFMMDPVDGSCVDVLAQYTPVHAGRNGNVLVVDPATSKYSVLQPGGKLVAFSETLTSIRAIRAASNGFVILDLDFVFVSYGTGLVTHTGSFGLKGSVVGPDSCAFRDDNTVFCLDAFGIGSYTPGGSYVSVLSWPDLTGIDGSPRVFGLP